MKKTRYSESQIIKVLKEVEGGRTVKAVCREYGESPLKSGHSEESIYLLKEVYP